MEGYWFYYVECFRKISQFIFQFHFLLGIGVNIFPVGFVGLLGGKLGMFFLIPFIIYQNLFSCFNE